MPNYSLSAMMLGDQFIDRLRAINFGTQTYDNKDWVSQELKEWADYLVGKPITDPTRAAELNLRDIYGVRNGTYNWAPFSAGIPAGFDPRLHYFSRDYLGALVGAYWTTRERIYLDKYLDALVDLTTSQKKQIMAAPRAAVPNALGLFFRKAQGIEEFAFFLEGLFAAFATIVKTYGDTAPRDPQGWLKTSLTSVSSIMDRDASLAPLQDTLRMKTILQNLVTDYFPEVLTRYDAVNVGYLPNQRIDGISNMLKFAIAYRELVDFGRLTDKLIVALKKQLDFVVLKDGGLYEQSLNYNGMMTTRFAELVKLAREYYGDDVYLNVDWVKQANDETVAFSRLIRAIVTPFGTNPQIGNNFWTYDPNGAPGAHPTQKSIALPYSGYYVQRSGWTATDAYLFFYGMRENQGHVTAGGNSIQVAAYGKQLLVTGGKPNYSAPRNVIDIYRSEASTWKTNTITVDGKSQTDIDTPNNAATQNPIAARWLDSEVFDYMEGAWNFGYGSGVSAEKDVSHTRKVIFYEAKKIWIVIDVMKSMDDSDHTYKQIWKFAPPENDSLTNTNGYANAQVKYSDLMDTITATSGAAASDVNFEIHQFGASINYLKFFGGSRYIATGPIGSNAYGYGYYSESDDATTSKSVDVQSVFSGKGSFAVISVLAPYMGASSGMRFTRQDGNGLSGVDITFSDGETLNVRAATGLTDMSLNGATYSNVDVLMRRSGGSSGEAILVTGDASNVEASYQQADGKLGYVMAPDTFSWGPSSSFAEEKLYSQKLQRGLELNDVICGYSFEDLIYGGGGDDSLSGLAGNDDLRGEGGADLLDGGAGDDSLAGGDGDDRIVGGEGNDVLVGGAGADRFIFKRGTVGFADQIVDLDDLDKIDLTDLRDSANRPALFGAEMVASRRSAMFDAATRTLMIDWTGDRVADLRIAVNRAVTAADLML